LKCLSLILGLHRQVEHRVVLILADLALDGEKVRQEEIGFGRAGRENDEASAAWVARLLVHVDAEVAVTPDEAASLLEYCPVVGIDRFGQHLNF
jgi:hypothetical protein